MQYLRRPRKSLNSIVISLAVVGMRLVRLLLPAIPTFFYMPPFSSVNQTLVIYLMVRLVLALVNHSLSIQLQVPCAPFVPGHGKHPPHQAEPPAPCEHSVSRGRSTQDPLVLDPSAHLPGHAEI